MGFSSPDRNGRLLESRLIARKAHGTQRYGNLPYVHHLDHTLTILERFGFTSTELLCAGLLHDVLEDTDMDRGLLATLTSEHVAALVDAVTDGEGKNRKARKARPLKLIPTVPGALLIKLADRIANVESAIATGKDSLLEMYSDEWEGFARALYEPEAFVRGRKEEARMWAYLYRLLDAPMGENPSIDIV